MDRQGFEFAVGLIRDWEGTRAQLQMALELAGFTKQHGLRCRGDPMQIGSVVVAFWSGEVALETYSSNVPGMMGAMRAWLDGVKEEQVPGVQIHSGPDWRLWEHPERLVFARRGL